MKSKKLLLPTIIIAVTVFAIIVYSFIFAIAMKPTVTEGKFPFTITYELDGETVTINDVYTARYVRNDGYADTKSRVYEGEIGNMGEGNTWYTLKTDETGRIELNTKLYPDYLMGDTEYDYFDDEAFEPQILFYDKEEQEFDDEETLAAKGVKLISFEYPEPIENSFVFSHLSYFSGGVVFLTLLFAILSLIVTMIFVRKEKDLKYRAVDTISIVLNFVICITILPFVSVLSILIDIEGGGPEFYYQIMYFIPCLMVLGITASVALRRKGYGAKAIIAELIGPAIFALYLIACSIAELL